jgi:hypothetical protein
MQIPTSMPVSKIGAVSWWLHFGDSGKTGVEIAMADIEIGPVNRPLPSSFPSLLGPLPHSTED